MRTISLSSMAATVALTAAVAAAPAAVAAPPPLKSISYSLDAVPPPISGQIPTSLTFTATGGFGLDLKSVPTQCGSAAAQLNPPDCPATSQIASGTVSVEILVKGAPYSHTTRPFKIYRGSGTQVWLIAAITGYKVASGTLTASGGTVTLTVNIPSIRIPVSSVTIQFQGLTMNLGARYVTVTRRRVSRRIRVHGRVKNVHRTVTTSRWGNLLSTPACSGGQWQGAITAGLSSGDVTIPTPLACR